MGSRVLCLPPIGFMASLVRYRSENVTERDIRSLTTDLESIFLTGGHRRCGCNYREVPVDGILRLPVHIAEHEEQNSRTESTTLITNK